MFLIDLGIDLGLDLGLHDMEYGQLHGHAGQRTDPAGIPVHHCLGVQFGAVGVWRAQDDDRVVFAVLVYGFFDAGLTLRVKGAGRGSDKALG